MKNFIGKYCVVRASGSGTFAGIVTEQNGAEVTLQDVRKLWRWDGATETLGLALHGVSQPEGCKFTEIVSEITILDANTIVPCTETAEASLRGVKAWKA